MSPADLDRAQLELNKQIVADCDPYIPFQQGALRNSLWYPDGPYGGVIEWNTPYAHYQYMGEVYGPNIPIKNGLGEIIGWFSPPKKFPTGRPITYHAPGTRAKWFEVAKADHLSDWVELVKNELTR